MMRLMFSRIWDLEGSSSSRDQSHESARHLTITCAEQECFACDGMPKTLDQIGDTFGVTRERIRQIESKTMAKLRHPSRSQSLRDYLE